MTKKLYLPFLMAMIVALMTSCSKKMGELSSDYFTVTPQVLEAVGGYNQRKIPRKVLQQEGCGRSDPCAEMEWRRS